MHHWLPAQWRGKELLGLMVLVALVLLMQMVVGFQRVLWEYLNENFHNLCCFLQHL